MEVDECGGWDFLEWVGPDTSACVFRLLDDPADLARAAAVSRSWRRFVIDNELSKNLCLRICPEVANFTRAVEVSRSPPPPAAHASESSHEAELRNLERDHRIYSYLSGALVSTKPSMDCILHCIVASSTDNFPDESIKNTLEPLDRINHRPSYWSSGGQDDADVPESLTYRLNSDLCIIDEIRIQPFKAYFQPGHPIYSSKSVRIRMGHSKIPHGAEFFVTDEDENLRVIADENYVWTYTSPEFPMLQENELQTFKLPRSVLCIGGVVKIELLGRVQKQDTDDRYYICVCHAQVIGRSLSPDFMVDISDPAGYSILKYLPGASNLRAEDIVPDDPRDSSEWHPLVARYKRMRHLAMMNVLLGPVQFMDEDDIGGVTDDDLYM
ncbi:F-box protein At4g00755-like [Phragmites australis]|uniref:F-box protein At4g00755-like n=1 Tax=Phragmites australis TaxID=29695 RepID=UPI002D777F80|nr:F-box protein At4g00755-like [Phragmites australis]